MIEGAPSADRGGRAGRILSVVVAVAAVGALLGWRGYVTFKRAERLVVAPAEARAVARVDVDAEEQAHWNGGTYALERAGDLFSAIANATPGARVTVCVPRPQRSSRWTGRSSYEGLQRGLLVGIVDDPANALCAGRSIAVPAASSAATRDVLIAIRADGSVLYEGAPVASDEDLLERARDGRLPGRHVFIAADERVAYARVVRVMDLLKQAGATRVAMLTAARDR